MYTYNLTVTIVVRDEYDKKVVKLHDIPIHMVSNILKEVEDGYTKENKNITTRNL